MKKNKQSPNPLRLNKSPTYKAALSLLLFSIFQLSAAQTTTPAYGGGWAEWDMFPGQWSTPQAYCDALLDHLKQTFGPPLTLFNWDSSGYNIPYSFRVPYSYTVYEYPDYPYMARCDARWDDGSIMFSGFTGWPGQMWLCPRPNIIPVDQMAGRGTTGLLKSEPYKTLFGPDRLFSTKPVNCEGTTPSLISQANKNAGLVCPAVGNPINHGFGTKLARERDLALADEFIFERRYTSNTEALPLFLFQGQHGSSQAGSRLWRTSLDRAVLAPPPQTPGSTAIVARPAGGGVEFRKTSGFWHPDNDSTDSLIEEVALGVRVGWKFISMATGSSERFDASGALLSVDQIDGKSLRVSRADGRGGIVPSGAPSCVLPAGHGAPSTLAAGLIQCVTNQHGRQLNFQYDNRGRMIKMIDPAGGEYVYIYDEASSVVLSGQALGGNLTSVKYPDGLRRIYHYNEQAYTANTNLPNALTGISDETTPGVFERYGIYKYDNQGRAISTEHIGGIDRYSVNYATPYQQSVVTDPLGVQRTYGFTTVLGVVKQTSLNQPAGAGCGPASSAISYDTNANVASRTDFNNTKTCYSYDLSRNLETRRIEGLPGAAVCAASFSNPPADARLVTTQWHPDWRLETRRAEPGLITTSVYNGQGASCAPADALVDGKPIAVLCRKTEQATTDDTGALGFAASPSGPARTSTFTYNRWGQVLTSNGPHGDASDTLTYSYYPDTQANWTLGDLRQISNGLGHVTRFTRYNRHGQVLERVEPNGLVTRYSYDLRQRLTRVQAGDEVSTYAYDAVGNLTQATLPEGGSVTYTYDPAHRLIAIQDPQGNRIDYTLDAMGNRIAEKTTDAAGVLRGNVTRTMDALNRVQKVVGGE